MTETLIKNTKFEINFFFKLCFFLIIFLSLDLSIQYFFGKNILGLTPHEGRISGIFGHEAIAGAYLQKIFIFSFIGMSFFLFDIENKKNSFLIILFLILIIFASFIGSNRISFFILISLIIFLSFFFSIFRKKLIFSILCIVPILYYFYQNDLSIKSRYSGFFYKTENLILNVKDIYLLKKNEKIGEIKNELSNDNSQIKESKLLLANHGKIYLTAFHSFKEKMFLGNGYKSFRSKCVIFTKKNDNYLCSTHPHNYHLEVLHDTGLIGFFILTLFIFSLLIKSLYRLFKTKLFYYEKLILSLLIINLSIELFPLKSTGSLLTTWNGTLVWIAVALINYKNYGNFVKKD